MSKLNEFDLNLASQPFRRERAQLTTALFLGVLLIVSVCMLGALILNSRAKAADLRLRIASDSQKLQALQLQQRRFGSVLSKPENTEVFSNSVFLNELIARRGLSWTRIFQDVEAVMPKDVRLLAIRLPQVAEQDAAGVNRIQLDMVVGTMQPESFLVLLKRLEKANAFGATAVVTHAPPSQNDPYHKYRLTVAYAQKL